MVRACQRAVISGAKLQLVVAARITWRMLGGLDGLVSIYPSLAAAVAAGPPDGMAVPPAEQVHRNLELLDSVVTSLFHVGLSLHVAMDLPADAARERIAAAVGHLDETIREVRETAFNALGEQTAARRAPETAS